MLAIVHAGPLYAAVDRAADEHQRVADTFERADLQFVVSAFVVAEVTYMVGRRLGSAVEARFLAGLAGMTVQAAAANDWPRIAALVAQYADFPLVGTDASVIALTERVNTELIMTLDHRHFRAVKPRHCATFRLLPEDA